MAKNRARTGEPIQGQALPIDQLLAELKMTRLLLVLLLAKVGSDSNEIGMALGLDPSTIRSWLSFSKVTKLSRNLEKE